MSQTEVDTIASSFKSQNFVSFEMSGVRVNGVKYQFLREVDGNEALKMSQTEVDTIASSFKSQNFVSFEMSGVRVNGVKYQFLREVDGNEVFAKKKSYGGIVMMKSKTAVVIAHYPEGSNMGNAAKGVGVIADYLESLGM